MPTPWIPCEAGGGWVGGFQPGGTGPEGYQAPLLLWAGEAHTHAHQASNQVCVSLPRPSPCSKSIRKQCGGGPSPSPNPTPDEPTEKCVADFNAATTGPCGSGSTVTTCCAALKGLGSCLDDIMSAMAQQKDKYADQLKQL